MFNFQQSCRSLETLLIGLYNLEVVDKSGQQKAISFRLPSLAMLSSYHEVCCYVTHIISICKYIYIFSRSFLIFYFQFFI